MSTYYVDIPHAGWAANREAWCGGVSPWHGGLLSGVFGGDGGGELGGLGLYALL